MRKLRQWRAAVRRKGAAMLLAQIKAANRMSYRAVEDVMHSGVVRPVRQGTGLSEMLPCLGQQAYSSVKWA